MTKLSGVLGNKYQSKRQQIFTRSFDLGGHTFKVRIPFVAESDGMFQRIMNPDEAHIKRLYDQMSEPLLRFKAEATPEMEIEFTETDVLVKGRSMREAAKNKAMTENKITEYIKLLIPEDEKANMDDITFADIEAEFPSSVQIALIEKIAEAISPTYKEARGN
jgi:hypothetical protein